MKTEYCVISHSNLDDFEEQASRCLSDGWKLHGGLVMTQDGNKMRYAQAMVRPVENNGDAYI